MIMFAVKTTKDFQHLQTDQPSNADLTDYFTHFFKCCQTWYLTVFVSSSIVLGKSCIDRIGLIIILFSNNMCPIQQTYSRSTDWIHQKSGFSERTSRGRETGQWQHFTNLSLSKLLPYYLLDRLLPLKYLCQGLKWWSILCISHLRCQH